MRKVGVIALARCSDLKQGSSTHGPRSSLPWPAGHFEKNNYKRDEIKSNFNNARWPLSYTAVF